jgi:hypothetical protein
MNPSIEIESATSALASAFAAGFAVQQALEILDALFLADLTPRMKRRFVAITSAILGVVFAFFGDVRILRSLALPASPFIDYVITALFISAGTEGVNSLLKFLQYKKEEQKGDAMQTKEAAGLDGATADEPTLVLPPPAVPAGL